MANCKVQFTSKATRISPVCFVLAFGFCEYENPEGTLRCIRLLNGWQIQDKKLVVSDFQLPIVFFFVWLIKY